MVTRFSAPTGAGVELAVSPAGWRGGAGPSSRGPCRSNDPATPRRPLRRSSSPPPGRSTAPRAPVGRDCDRSTARFRSRRGDCGRAPATARRSRRRRARRSNRAGIVEFGGDKRPGLSSSFGRGADHGVESRRALVQPAPDRGRVAAPPLGQRASQVGYAVGPSRLRMPQEGQMPLYRFHPSSLPAERAETTLLPPPLHLPRRTCASPSAIQARRLRPHRRPRQRRRRLPVFNASRASFGIHRVQRFSGM